MLVPTKSQWSILSATVIVGAVFMESSAADKALFEHLRSVMGNGLILAIGGAVIWLSAARHFRRPSPFVWTMIWIVGISIALFLRPLVLRSIAQ